jgi:hypothetical protein
MPYGSDFTVQLYDSTRVNSITRVVLIRPGATTHSFDQNQRYVPLDFHRPRIPKAIVGPCARQRQLAPPATTAVRGGQRGSRARNVPPSRAGCASRPRTPLVVDTGECDTPAGWELVGLQDLGPSGSCQPGVELLPVRAGFWDRPGRCATVAFQD